MRRNTCLCSSSCRPRPQQQQELEQQQQKVMMIQQVLVLPLRSQPPRDQHSSLSSPQQLLQQPLMMLTMKNQQSSEDQRLPLGYVYSINVCGKSCICSVKNRRYCFMATVRDKPFTSSSYEEEVVLASDTDAPNLLEYYCVFVSSDSPKTRHSWISLHHEDPHHVIDTEVSASKKKVKRWSFCYGEDGKFEVLPKRGHAHDMKGRSWLLQSFYNWKLPRCKSQVDLFTKTNI